MNNYCTQCGAKLEPEKKHKCPKSRDWVKIKSTLMRLANSLTNDENVGQNIDYYEHGKAIIPDSIEAENGEVTVKQYDLATLRTRHKLTHAEGRMQITNKRIIFRSAGRSPAGKTVYQSEFAMDKIDGVEIRKDYRFLFWDFFKNLLLSSIFWSVGNSVGLGFFDTDSILLAIFTFLLALASAVPFFTLRQKHLIKLFVLSIGQGAIGAVAFGAKEQGDDIVAALAGIILTILCILYLVTLFLSFFKPNLVVEVKTSSGSPGLQIKHRYSSFFIWKKMEENSGFSEILPAKDADLAIKEIGAIISDIKTLGDFGVDKWRTKK